MTTPTDPTTPPTDEAPGSEDDHKYQPGADGLCSCQRDTPPTDEALRALVEAVDLMLTLQYEHGIMCGADLPLGESRIPLTCTCGVDRTIEKVMDLRLGLVVPRPPAADIRSWRNR